MRRFALPVLLGLALAAPAAAQSGKITVVKPPEKGVLRGTMAATPPPADAPDPLLLPLPAPITRVNAPDDQVRQCRRECARDYYFCLADGEETCPQTWSQCTAGCGT